MIFQQFVWLLVAAAVAGAEIFAVAERALEDVSRRRAIVFAARSAGLIFLVLFRTLKMALGHIPLLVLAFAAKASIFIFAFRRGGHRYVDGLLAIILLIAISVWAVSSLDQSQSWLATPKQDFEVAKFKRKPNIHLLNYDGYGSENLYGQVFGIDNAAHFRRCRHETSR